jgi:predicted TIM-barrel fold metal-dependent hydrolase
MAAWRIYSSDDHLDLWSLPVDVWKARTPARLHKQVPHVETIDGTEWWVMGERKVSPRQSATVVERIGEACEPERVARPELRLKDMDRDGVYASVLYGPAVVSRFAPDEAKTACVQAWNDFCADFDAAGSGRLALLGVLPTESGELAASELERVAELGLRGVQLDPFSIDYREEQWHRVWAAAGATGLPISFHLGGGTSRLNGAAKGWEWAAHRAVVQLQLDEPLAAMIMSGALEDNPGFTLVAAECGAGWFAYFLNRMDETVENRSEKLRSDGFSLKQKPSEIFKQQVMVSFEQEKEGATLLPLVGTDRFMWGSDYPHLDSTWPNSAQAIADAVGGLPEADQRLITSENCRRLYKFE